MEALSNFFFKVCLNKQRMTAKVAGAYSKRFAYINIYASGKHLLFLPLYVLHYFYYSLEELIMVFTHTL